MFRIKGGTSQILTALSSSFDSDDKIKLGTVVTSIKVVGDIVKVVTKSGDGSTKVSFTTVSYRVSQNMDKSINIMIILLFDDNYLLI